MFIDSQDNEILLFDSRSPVAAVPRTDAIRIFPVGQVRGDGGVWRDGLSLLGR